MKKLAILLTLALLSGCDDMNKQARNQTDSDKSNETPVQESSELVSNQPDLPPPALTQGLVERGQDEFNAFCSPCHSERGDGKGMVVQRGFPQPPSFHSEQARAMQPAEMFTVISDGRGAMYSFAGRIRPVDRWAIVAYVRALQVSRAAKLADVPADAREGLR